MKAKLLMLVVLFVVFQGCDIVPEFNYVEAESQGIFDIFIYSQGSSIISSYNTNSFDYMVYGPVSVRIIPLNDNEVDLYINGIHKDYIPVKINDF